MSEREEESEVMPELSAAAEPASTQFQPSADAKKRSLRKRIGRYKLLQKIAEGGMGAVYMAQQEEPIRRQVALKVIKAEKKDSEQIIARFEAERQALAMMDHPNIAKILDAGVDTDGSPYFVMELVQGVPITKYCDTNKLTIAERLELFIPVCQAVQHAHVKGIIHRDLHPGNVLVGNYDGRPVPKVIDFGLAKATQHATQLTDNTMYTEFGAIVGTLRYMSPEQAGLDQLDIDTRTDVYSLGVMLYELLTGSTPLDHQSANQFALLKVLELIRDNEPPRPSHRLSSVETASDVGQRRDIAPEKLRRLLKGELDWVVMKALEKNRNRRYETATDLVQDIGRYLRNEAVMARPPSTAYRLSKLVKANRGFFTAVSLTIVSLLVASVVSVSAAFYAQNAYWKEQQTSEELQERNEELKTEQEKTLAEVKRRKLAEADAVENAKKAEESAKQEKRFKEEAESKTSGTNFLLSAADWALDRPSSAWRSLNRVLEKHRFFEWYFLRHHFDADTFSISQDNQCTAIAVTPDARFVASAQGKVDFDLGRIEIWDAGSGKRVSTIDVGNESVSCIEFSPDGQYLAAGFEGFVGKKDQESPKVRIYDPFSGTLVLEIAQQVLRVDNIAYSGDGKLLAVENGPEWKHTVDLYDTSTGKKIRSINVPQKNIDNLRIVGNRIYVHGSHTSNSSVMVWDTQTGKSVGAYAVRMGAKQFDISESGKFLVWVPIVIPNQPSLSAVMVEDLDTGKRFTIPKCHNGLLNSIDIATDESSFATSSFDGTIRVWDMLTGQLKHTCKSDGDQAFQVCFSPNGRQIFGRIYVLGAGWQVKAWNLDHHNGRVTYSTRSTVKPYLVNRDQLATISESGSLQLWSTSPLRITETIPGFSASEYFDFRFSSDGRYAAGVTLKGELVQYDRESGKPEIHSLYPNGGPIYFGAVWPNDIAIFALQDESTVEKVTLLQAWDLKTRRRIWSEPISNIGCFQIQKVGQRVITWQMSKQCRVLDAISGKQLLTLDNVPSRFYIDAATEELFLVRKVETAGSKYSLQVYDTNECELVRESTSIRQDESVAIKASRDALFLLKHAEIEVVDRKTLSATENDLLKGHKSQVMDVVVHPTQENRLVSIGQDSNLKIWDLETRKEMFSLPGVDIGRKSEIVFDPQGQYIMLPVSGSHFQWFRANSPAQEMGSWLKDVYADSSLDTASRIYWHRRRARSAANDERDEIELYHLAFALQSDPANPFAYAKFHYRLKEYEKEKSGDLSSLAPVVRDMTDVPIGQVNPEDVDELIDAIAWLARDGYPTLVEQIASKALADLDEQSIELHQHQLLRGFLGLALYYLKKKDEAYEHLEYGRKLKAFQRMRRVNSEIYWNYQFTGDECANLAIRFSEKFRESVRQHGELDLLARTAWEDFLRLKQTTSWKVYEAQGKMHATLAEVFFNALEHSGDDLLFSKDFEHAKAVYSTLLTLREKISPEDWSVDDTQSRLGECFFEAGQLELAKTTLQKAWKELSQRQTQISEDQKYSVQSRTLKLLIQVATDLKDESLVEQYRQALESLAE